MQLLGDGESLSIAKNHPKPSQEFSERFGPFIHKMNGFCRNSPQKFTRISPKTWEDKFLGIPLFWPKITGETLRWVKTRVLERTRAGVPIFSVLGGKGVVMLGSADLIILNPQMCHYSPKFLETCFESLETLSR